MAKLRGQTQPQMSDAKVLLIQVRNDTDPMRGHELECVQRRLQGCNATVRSRNALAQPAEAQWLDNTDFVIIGGSGDFSVHHPRSQRFVNPLRALLDELLRRRVPGFGICFGHQLLGYHLGAPVNTDERHAELGTVAIRLTDEGREDPVFGEMGALFDAHTGHSDHVSEIPDGTDVLASSAGCPQQGFRVRGTNFISTQFHPDMTAQEAQNRYLAYQYALDHVCSEAAGVPSVRFSLGSDVTTRLISTHFQQTMRNSDPD